MPDIIGITRVRNEALIIEDTMRHFLHYCSDIVLYDDASTDDTVERAQNAAGDRLTVIHGDTWRTDRQGENTRHRRIVCDTAAKMGAEWVLCFDADERLVGELPPLTADGYKFRLFDGYMTAAFADPYRSGPLENLERMWGPEYRDILMLFRPEHASWNRTGLRAPVFSGKVELAPVYVKHYGKCLSVQHWEETCQYYMQHFPAKFRRRWAARRGKAIHTLSDFNRTLYTWDQLLSGKFAWHKIHD